MLNPLCVELKETYVLQQLFKFRFCAFEHWNTLCLKWWQKHVRMLWSILIYLGLQFENACRNTGYSLLYTDLIKLKHWLVNSWHWMNLLNEFAAIWTIAQACIVRALSNRRKDCVNILNEFPHWCHCMTVCLVKGFRRKKMSLTVLFFTKISKGQESNFPDY